MTELVRMEIFGVTELARAFQQSPQTVSDELAAATAESLALMEREIKELTPIGVSGGGGGLRDSISARPVQKLSASVVGVVGTNITYAEGVELGTRPHFPPIEPLADWAHFKLDVPREESRGVAYLIARKISRVGTKGQHMFKRGFKSTSSQVVRIFNKARTRILQRIASGR